MSLRDVLRIAVATAPALPGDYCLPTGIAGMRTRRGFLGPESLMT